MSHSHTEMQGEKNKKVLFFSLILSLFLSIIKLVSGIFSGSLALLSSGLDSLMDSFSSIVNIFIMHFASQPADDDHSFGHGKYEAFSSLFQSIIISIAAFSLIIYSFSTLFTFFFVSEQNIERESHINIITIGVVILSILVPFLLSFIIKKYSNTENSPVMQAEYSHFWADSIMNLGVLISILFSYFFHIIWIDSLVGMIISLFLIHEAFLLFIKSFNILTDKELDDAIVLEIKNILDSSTEIYSWHALRTRQSGSEYHIDIHLEFPADIPLKKAHNCSLLIEERIIEKYSNAIILTHFDYKNDL